MSNIDLTAQRLREFLDYNPETGIFTRRTTQRRWKAGTAIGWQMNTGYIAIVIDGRQYLAHRLAWLHVNGTHPAEYIDHLNGVRTDNRISNLREANHSVNQQNQRLPKAKNRTGFLGVVPHGRQFRAQISFNGKTVHLADCATPEEAHAIYLRAKAQLHPGSTITQHEPKPQRTLS